MKDSLFRKRLFGAHSSADFTKDEAPVLSFDTDDDLEELKRHIAAELDGLFSKIRDSGFLREELELDLMPREKQLAVRITRSGGKPFKLAELNLIFRLAADAGLSPMTVRDGIEILSAIPRLEDSKLYAHILLQLRESFEDSFEQ